MFILGNRLTNVLVVFLTEHHIVDLQQELEECARNLDIARGNFQIAMVVNLASDIDKSSGFSVTVLIVSES